MDKTYEIAKYRKLILSDDVTQGSVNTIMAAIFDINHNDRLCEEKLKDYEAEPIELYINSFGGSAYDGLALLMPYLPAKHRYIQFAMAAA